MAARTIRVGRGIGMVKIEYFLPLRVVADLEQTFKVKRGRIMGTTFEDEAARIFASLLNVGIAAAYSAYEEAVEGGSVNDGQRVDLLDLLGVYEREGLH